MFARGMSLMALLVVPASSFVVVGAHTSPTGLASTASSAEDLLKPTYEVEPIGIRIGHGFDIHRMAPIADAGQPLVIGGVEITHTDQKVRFECITA